MNKQIADLILQWHNVFVAIGTCIESARVVLDQSDRGTLLPDRVRELRGELLQVQENIPALADLMEELTGETTWPMSVPGVTDTPDPDEEADAELAAAMDTPAEDTEPPATAEGDYDAGGSTPVESGEPSAEVFEDEVAGDEESAAEADATGAP